MNTSNIIFEVYDIEVLRNCFTYTGYRIHTKTWYQFVIHESRNDIKELINHLSTKNLVQIGFNNENYDYPVIHHILNHKNEYLEMPPEYVSGYIYDKSQEVISMDFSSIADKNKFIHQIDLFCIWHYNNKARSTSLKALEVCMRLPNVEDMPIHHSKMCDEKDIPLILSYNKNDVYATAKFFLVTLGKTEYSIYKNKNKLDLRLKLQSKFNLKCINYPDVKIGEQLLLKLYLEKTGFNYWDVKNSRTYRKLIYLKECIPPWANFETKEFNNLKQKFSSSVISNIKGEFKDSVIFHGIKLDYGTGGVHSCIKSGVYESNDDWIIVDQDVGSLYPSLAIQLNIYPEHLGRWFIEIYSDIVNTRLNEKKKPKKERDPVIMEGYKLGANGIYGKSGEESSFLYDPLYTMKTTVGGQMFLSLWSEKLVKHIPEIKFIQHNTDGISYLVPRSKLHLVELVKNEMTELTGLYIEDSYYNKMVIRDVNNYLAEYIDGSVKYKGCFEIDKEFHKDPSMRIVPIALSNYFLKGIPVEETIKNHRDIYDFCLMLKINSNFIGEMRSLNDSITLSKTTRYYISNKGYNIVKIDPNIKCGNRDYRNLTKSGFKETGVNVGFVATNFNKFVDLPFDEYDINYKFYIIECNKIINAIEDAQLMFDF